MKIGASVILYHPTQEVIQNILSYINEVDFLYIFDNTEGNDNIELLKDFPKSKYDYFWNGSNEGISKPLNMAINKSLKAGYDYLMCMDQDSYFLPQNIKQYIEDIKQYTRQDVALFGVNFFKEEKVVEPQTKVEQDTFTITSGSVINIKHIPKDLRFDENLFIDAVDFDFCFNILKHQLKILKFGHNFLVHSLGKIEKKASIKTLYLIKKEKQIHSPIRLYYMYRNAFYIKDKYGEVYEKEIKDYFKTSIRYVKSCLYYSDEPFTILKYMKKAKKDYKENRMGRLSG